MQSNPDPLTAAYNASVPQIEEAPVRRKEFKAIAVFIAICLGLVGLGLGALWWSIYLAEPMKDLVRSAGDAFVVAGLLAMTVEWFLKARLIGALTYDASHYLIGYGLPTELQGRIRGVMSTNLIFRDYDQTYEFIKEADGLRITIDSSYYLDNYGAEIEKYQQAVGIPEWDAPEILELSCYSSESDASYCLTPTHGLTTETTFRHLVARATEIRIRPNAGERTNGPSYRIHSRFSLKRKLEPSDILAFARAVINIRIRILERPVNLEVQPESIATVAPNSQQDYWEWRQAFLPGEALRISWRWKESQPASICDH